VWSGYWDLTDAERPLVRRVFLHRTKAERSHFGGEVVRIFSASEDPELDAQRQPELADRWVLVSGLTRRPRTLPGRGQITSWPTSHLCEAYSPLYPRRRFDFSDQQ